MKKYILTIELEKNPGNDKNYFFFGLVKNEGKDNTFSYS
jgi:hypothetical protein